MSWLYSVKKGKTKGELKSFGGGGAWTLYKGQVLIVLLGGEVYISLADAGYDRGAGYSAEARIPAS